MTKLLKFLRDKHTGRSDLVFWHALISGIIVGIILLILYFTTNFDFIEKHKPWLIFIYSVIGFYIIQLIVKTTFYELNSSTCVLCTRKKKEEEAEELLKQNQIESARKKREERLKRKKNIFDKNPYEKLKPL